MSRCRWVEDAELPTGRFLVPGCWNRAIGGDDADCHCPDEPLSLQDQIDQLREELARVLPLAERSRDTHNAGSRPKPERTPNDA